MMERLTHRGLPWLQQGDAAVPVVLVTDAAGKFQAGPFHSTDGYSATAIKAGYSLVPTAHDPFTFDAHTLSAISVNVVMANHKVRRMRERHWGRKTEHSRRTHTPLRVGKCLGWRACPSRVPHPSCHQQPTDQTRNSISVCR
jgi:hypothetical protein